jgi:hypothetical protein
MNFRAHQQPEHYPQRHAPQLGATCGHCGVLYRERQSDEWVFMSERGPFTRDGFAKLVHAAADRAGIANVYPHAPAVMAGDEGPRFPARADNGGPSEDLATICIRSRRLLEAAWRQAGTEEVAGGSVWCFAPQGDLS